MEPTTGAIPKDMAGHQRIQRSTIPSLPGDNMRLAIAVTSAGEVGIGSSDDRPDDLQPRWSVVRCSSGCRRFRDHSHFSQCLIAWAIFLCTGASECRLQIQACRYDARSSIGFPPKIVRYDAMQRNPMSAELPAA